MGSEAASDFSESRMVALPIFFLTIQLEVRSQLPIMVGKIFLTDSLITTQFIRFLIIIIYINHVCAALTSLLVQR